MSDGTSLKHLIDVHGECMADADVVITEIYQGNINAVELLINDQNE